MDSVTQTIVNYIEQTDVTNREDLLSVARIAFLDYLASLAPAENEQAVQDLVRFIGAKSSISSDVSRDMNSSVLSGKVISEGNTGLAIENVSKADKALYYGFASHYLDFDDAQANLAGHFSTILYSALLAVIEPMERILSSLYHRCRARGYYWFPYQSCPSDPRMAFYGDRWCDWGSGRYRRFARPSW